MDNILGMTHPGENSSPSVDLWNLNKKLSVSKTQWWERDRIIITDIPILEGRK